MIEKLKKSLNPVLLAFLAYAVKILIVDVSFADGIVLAVLAGILGFSAYLNSKSVKELNRDQLKEVKADVQEVKSALSSLNMSQIKSNKNKTYF